MWSFLWFGRDLMTDGRPWALVFPPLFETRGGKAKGLFGGNGSKRIRYFPRPLVDTER
jgi:hypothetical protein